VGHSCPDGTRTKLVRTGPIGTLEGVTFHCPRCGYTKSAETIMADTKSVLGKVTAR